MPRERRPKDWAKDVGTARIAEAAFYDTLKADDRLSNLEDLTASFDTLDFRFGWGGRDVFVDLKEKRQPYARGYGDLWPEVSPGDLFILDETVYRRIIWQGGGGYLVVHDHPGARWAIFGPWELTLGPRIRFQRWGRRSGPRFGKGKLLLNLAVATHVSKTFEVDHLLSAIDRATLERDSVQAVALKEQVLPEIRDP